MTKNLIEQSKMKSQKMNALILSVLLTLTTGGFMFAAGDLESVLTGALTAAKTIISAIFNPVCVVALGICIVILVIGRNSKSADASMSWAKRIVICFVIFNIMGTILSWLADTAFQTGTGLTEYAFISGLPIY